MLAEKLGMTVARLRCEMTTAEYAQWIGYLQYQAAMADVEAKKAQMKADMEGRR